jgi:hypothetical protein
MDGHAHQRGLHDRAPFQRARELVALKAGQSRPQADVHRRRVLRLHPADPFERARERFAPACQQQLPLEQRAVELALTHDALGPEGHRAGS